MQATTTDLSKFGYHEWDRLRDLINAMMDHGLPDDFANEDVVPMFNRNSGNVFFTNNDCQVAMMNGDKLESFYSCPECGEEGFVDDLRENGATCCNDYLNEVLK